MFRRLVLQRPVATLATLIVFSIGCLLGNWQINRMHEKLAAASDLAAKQAASPINLNNQTPLLDQALHHSVLAKGVYLADKTIWLENRPHPQGQDPKTGVTAGFYVLTPMRLDKSGSIVWVNRGWAPRDMLDRTLLPNIVTPTGSVEVQGVVFAFAARVMDIGANASDSGSSHIAQNLDLNKEAHQFDGRQLPFIVRQSANHELDGLNRDWMPAASGAEKHQGYAFQWFALAVVALLFWLITGLKKEKS